MYSVRVDFMFVLIKTSVSSDGCFKRLLYIYVYIYIL